MTGFNKRILSKKNILLNLDNLETVLNSDCFYISDEFSMIVYRMYVEGKSNEEILEVINKIKNDENGTFKWNDIKL